MTKEGRIPNLRCDDESDCIEDLGIQCLRNELLDEILGSEHTTTQVQVGKRHAKESCLYFGIRLHIHK